MQTRGGTWYDKPQGGESGQLPSWTSWDGQTLAGRWGNKNKLAPEWRLGPGGHVCAMGGGRGRREKGKETELGGAEGLGWGPAGKTGQAIWRKAVDTASHWARPTVEAGKPWSTG